MPCIIIINFKNIMDSSLYLDGHVAHKLKDLM